MKDNLLIEYETVLKTCYLSNLANIYMRGDKKAKCKTTLSLVKYVIEHIYYYTPQEALSYLTLDELYHFKLRKYIEECVSFPSSMNDSDKFKYLLSLCYPKEIHFDLKEWTLDVYKKVLNSNITDKKRNFPLGFFDDEDGMYRACTCLMYVLSRYIIPEKAKNLQELYDLFGHKKECIKLLKQYKLYEPLTKFYCDDPVLYLHFTLIDEQKDEFLFKYYEFMEKYNNLCNVKKLSDKKNKIEKASKDA